MSFSVQHPAHAADDTPEREQLAALARQFDLIDRLAEHATNTAPQSRRRYHFDYARLRADLKRVRAGVQDYLVPQRAQPRDPVSLTGDYVRRDDREESAP
ncbi:RAQPRD family integrative conjugative element protein [Aromatoleum toluclasticum]|uniref:integrative conjugative element protein, RAQPRD family n=1 Tax=Aromatoleum toluclasticum TaxID=92003 RepID=UPI003F69410F